MRPAGCPISGSSAGRSTWARQGAEVLICSPLAHPRRRSARGAAVKRRIQRNLQVGTRGWCESRDLIYQTVSDQIVFVQRTLVSDLPFWHGNSPLKHGGRSSPIAAQRCAAGAGLDGTLKNQATIQAARMQLALTLSVKSNSVFYTRDTRLNSKRKLGQHQLPASKRHSRFKVGKPLHSRKVWFYLPERIFVLLHLRAIGRRYHPSRRYRSWCWGTSAAARSNGE
jgi:hypothetical protein